MRPFRYARAETVEEAVELLSGSSRGAVLAGGTDLLSLMKDDLEAPDLLVDVKQIEGLSGSSVRREGVRIGAATRLSELEADSRLATMFPAIAQAISGISSPQIRNMGTVGGELLQRPRCWYFRNGFGLLAQKRGRSLVEQGENRYHAIFAKGAARFVHASSLAPVLMAYGAQVEVAGPGGVTVRDVEDLFRAPSREGEREHTLSASELVTAVLLPAGGQPLSAAYEVRPRRSLDWPLVQAAVSFVESDGLVKSARVVLGHVAATPRMSHEAAEVLLGVAWSEGHLRDPLRRAASAAGSAAVVGATPLAHNRYKVQLAEVAVKRAVLRAGGVEV